MWETEPSREAGVCMSIAFADETIKAMFTEVLMTFASLPNSEWRKIYDKKQTNNKQLLVEAINR